MDRRSIVLVLALLSSFSVAGTGLFWFSDRAASDRPSISAQEATHIVSSVFPNSRILVIQLDKKEGRLVYDIDLVTAEAYKKEVYINAGTGQVEKILTVTSGSHPIA